MVTSICSEPYMYILHTKHHEEGSLSQGIPPFFHGSLKHTELWSPSANTYVWRRQVPQPKRRKKCFGKRKTANVQVVNKTLHRL